MTRNTRFAALASVALTGLAGLVLFGGTAQATVVTPTGPTFDNCKNLSGWYANPDEQSDLPEPTVAGLKFENKDLIHHKISTPIDFADMDKVQYSFVATVPGKVVFKVETANPYSTIVTNADGKLWSTAMDAAQVGGQGSPVAKYSDLIGKPVKAGKVPFGGTSVVGTFGVGYWVPEGSTVVSSITFHGTTYPLTCVLPSASPSPSKSSVSPSPSTSVSPSKSTSASPSASVSVSPSKSTSVSPSASKDSRTCADFATQADAQAAFLLNPTGLQGLDADGDGQACEVDNGGSGSNNGSGDLPKTGPSVGIFIGLAVILAGAGGALFYFTRRRKVSFVS